MVARAFVARHAESESNAANVLNGDPSVAVALTERGRAQATELRAALRDEVLDLVVTSEFPRTIETADLVLGDRVVPRVVLAELNDPRGGEWEGMDLDAYLRWAAAAGADDAPPGGESLRSVFARIASALRAIERRPEGVALVIGHGLPISTALAAVEGELDDRAVYPPVPHAVPFVLAREQLDLAARRIERAVAR